MYEVVIETTFDAAHRLLNYDGPCQSLHGHLYRVNVSVESKVLNNNGFVIDFAVLKQDVTGWIKSWWDHSTLLNREDPLVEMLRSLSCKVFVFDNDPTAEQMAEYLFDTIYGLIHMRDPNLTLGYVRIDETPTSFAYYRRSE